MSKFQISAVLTLLGGFRSISVKMFSRWLVYTFYQMVAPPVISPILQHYAISCRF